MDETLRNQHRELMRRLVDLLETSGDHAEVTGPDGAPWQVHREPDGSLVMDIANTGPMVTRGWQPTDHRPPDYPPDLPFLAGTTACTVVTAGLNRMTMVQWLSVPDADPVLEQLVTQSLADGWQEGEASPVADPPGKLRQFVRGGLKRIISRTRISERDILMLMQVDLGKVNSGGDR